MRVENFFRPISSGAAAHWRGINCQIVFNSLGTAPWVVLVATLGLPSTFQPLILDETWWLLLLTLWIFPRPLSLIADRANRYTIVVIIVIGALFGWLYYRTVYAHEEMLGAWEGILGWHWSDRLSMVMGTTAAGLLATMVIAFPMWRLLKVRLFAVTVLSSSAYVLFVWGRFRDQSTWVLIHLPWGAIAPVWQLLFPSVLLVCTMPRLAHLERHRPHLANDLDRVDRWWRSILGEAGFKWAPTALYVVLAALVAACEYESIAPHHDSSNVWDLASAVSALILVLIAVVPFRQLSRFKRHGFLAANGASLGQFVLALTGIPLIVCGLLFHAPDALRFVTGSIRHNVGEDWHVEFVRPTVLRISGRFTSGIGERVEHAIQENPSLRLVVLRSPGGNMYEGERVAKAIHAHHLSTTVEFYCASACAIAFAGGGERILERDAHLGFHGCTTGVWFRDCTDAEVEEQAIYKELGIDPSFIHKADQVPNSSAWYPTAEELTAAHVITATVLKPRSQLTAEERKAREDALAGRTSANVTLTANH